MARTKSENTIPCLGKWTGSKVSSRPEFYFDAPGVCGYQNSNNSTVVERFLWYQISSGRQIW